MTLPNRDHRYRLIVSKEVRAGTLAELGREQDWANFKNEVARFGGRDDYERALHPLRRSAGPAGGALCVGRLSPARPGFPERDRRIVSRGRWGKLNSSIGAIRAVPALASSRYIQHREAR